MSGILKMLKKNWIARFFLSILMLTCGGCAIRYSIDLAIRPQNGSHCDSLQGGRQASCIAQFPDKGFIRVFLEPVRPDSRDGLRVSAQLCTINGAKLDWASSDAVFADLKKGATRVEHVTKTRDDQELLANVPIARRPPKCESGIGFTVEPHLSEGRLSLPPVLLESGGTAPGLVLDIFDKRFAYPGLGDWIGVFAISH